MSALPHRVRRLTIRVRTGSEGEAFALRKALREELSTALLPALERAFEEADVGGDLIAIPRLEAHVRIDGAGAIEEELPALLQRELAASLRSSMAGAGGGAKHKTYSERREPPGDPPSSPPGGGPLATGARPSPREVESLRVAPIDLVATPRGGDPAGGSPLVGARESEASRARPSGESGSPAGSPFEAGARGAGSAGAGASRVAAISAAASLSRFEMLVAYLETGSLPWPLAGVDRAVSLEVLRSAATEDLGRLVDRASRPAATAGRVALWLRLVALLPEASLPVLARAVSARAAPPAGVPPAEVIAVLSTAPPPGSSPFARLRLIAAALCVSLSPDEIAVEEAAGVLSSVLGEPARPRGARAVRPDTSGLPEPARAFFERLLGAAIVGDGAQPDGDREASSPPTGTAPRTPPEARAPRGEAPRLSSDTPPPSNILLPATLARSPDATPAHEKPLSTPVSHAGLILLHPYLSRFFASVGVLPPRGASLPASFAAPIPEAELPRAAALLHLLATGEDDVHELDLGFIKVLLGLPATAPLPVAAGLLGDADREEADALLGAVIGHWTALKSTSVRGLRGSFLQRRGLLREEAQGHLLRVEPAPFDVLLERLPWGIGIVKASWMKRPIFTEWGP